MEEKKSLLPEVTAVFEDTYGVFNTQIQTRGPDDASPGKSNRFSECSC